ncbi:hypothetical protein THTE_1889 [Thermogutta terrifontis]|uniref:Uncharacterized protein n=1 Tax=Thermogutta terrifontis TaxID=1331910 RepID=A0A286REW2_9BACT|nr:hypothetical protein THTE_1889 [Thermogutta terrifontis]
MLLLFVRKNIMLKSEAYGGAKPLPTRSARPVVVTAFAGKRLRFF